MKTRTFIVAVSVLTLAGSLGLAQPALHQKGTATQLHVDGKPFLMLGVETTNKLLDDSGDLTHLDENFAMYRAAGVNTVLIPITWRSLEPVEDQYDYTMIDALIAGGRRHDLKLVVLWFGAIKNGQVGFAPRWFADDRARFFRAQKPDGSEGFCISPFCEAAITADCEAFVLLMGRIRQQDAEGKVVIMVQPENETGCAGFNDERDHCPAANEAWSQPVPPKLLAYLEKYEEHLLPWLEQVWEANGKKTTGTWPEVFGDAAAGNHVFMSFYMARFVEQVAKAGRDVYDLPMFANDWLGSLREPGGPIGGPDFQMMDIWRCAAPSLDAFAPDIYFPPFKGWCAAYHTKGNPLLIPEAGGRHFRGDVSAQCWYAFVEHDALLYAPYLNLGNEANPDHAQSAAYFKLSRLDISYPVLARLSPVILEKQGRTPREMTAFLVDRDEKAGAVYERVLKGWRLRARALVGVPTPQPDQAMVTPFACVFWMGEGQLLIVGTKMALTLSRDGEAVAIREATGGAYVDGHWQVEGPARYKQDGGAVELRLTTNNLEIEQVWFTLKNAREN